MKTILVTGARAIFSLLDHHAPAGLYHMVGSGVASWFDFAKEIFKLADYSVTVNPVSATAFPSKVLRPSYSVLNNEKIQRAIQYAIPNWKISLANWFELHSRPVAL